LQLEEELQQSGLLVKQMDDDILKVNLSSDGMFAFDSARLKDGARPALEKLAERHFDTSKLALPPPIIRSTGWSMTYMY